MLLLQPDFKMQFMISKKYIYNKKSLSYEPVKTPLSDYLKKGLVFISFSLILALFITFTLSEFYDTPEEARLKNQNVILQSKLTQVDTRMDSLHQCLNIIQDKDDNLYRLLLGEEPLNEDIRLAGIGGYARLQGFNNNMELSLIEMDRARARAAVQNSSFDEITYLALKQADEINSQPKIFPIAEKDLIRFASKYGYRIHPIYKIRKLHKGVDLTAKTGSLIYATAPGKVVIATNSHDGYGNKIVIDHGNGYKSVYAHLSRFNVKYGQEVNLASIIGEVGNSGSSIAPHLHYEVRINNQAVDPANYFYRDFSEAEFEKLVALGN